MPNRWPIASGSWSNAAIWSGSLIPTASDDVFTNNQRVNIDTNVTIRSIRNSATGSAIASTASNMCFYLNDGVTLTANAGGVIGNSFIGAIGFPTIIVSGSSSATIIANITSSIQYGTAIIIDNGASLTITGSIGAPYNGSTQHRTIRTLSTGSLRISGSVFNADSAYFGSIIWIQAATRVDINGNLFGSNGPSGFYTIQNDVAGAVITVTGSLIGSTAGTIIYNGAAGTIGISGSILCTGTTLGIDNRSTGTIIITGSVIAANGVAINNISTGTISITGSVAAGLGASGITTSGAGILRIIGPISSSVSFPGIQSTSTGNVFLTGPFLNRNNRNAVFAQNLQLISGSTTTWTFDTETFGEQRTLYTQNYPGNFPSASNVRQGTVFGDTAQFTGTVAIPSTGSVLKGVPVDNVTGSASFTTQNVWSTPTSSLTASNSLGARLRNTATVASDGILIALTGSL